MLAPCFTRAKSGSGGLKLSGLERSMPAKRTMSNTVGHAFQPFTHNREPGQSWNFSEIPLFPPDRMAERVLTMPVSGDALVRAENLAGDKDEDTPQRPEEAQPCGDCGCAACTEEKDKHAKDAPMVPVGSGLLALASAGDGRPLESLPAQDTHHPHHPPPHPHTFTFISRGSYGETTPHFSPPHCAAAARGASTMVAGSASPRVNVFPRGTYQVRRDDGVVQTATCTRLAAGLAATRTHENHHAAGARTAATAANTAQGLPRHFATQALCAAALPGVLAAWNTSVNAAWANEVSHGPGTLAPTAQTFTQENAAHTCRFS